MIAPDPVLAEARAVSHEVGNTRARDVARWFRGIGLAEPTGVFVFGSGWSPLVERVEVIERWSYAEVPGLPDTSVEGHPGHLVLGRWQGIPCLFFVGRWHVYEGRTPAEAALPGFIAAALGCRWLFCTNAAGGIAPNLRVGQLVALTDDLGLWSDSAYKTRPMDGVDAFNIAVSGFITARIGGPVYSARLLAALSEAAVAANVQVEKGVLAMMPGPNYETAAEIAMLRAAGATVVSMSTVPEARSARLHGVAVAGLSCVTNLTPARPDSPLAHEHVLHTLGNSCARAGDLIEAWLDHPIVRAV